jgi:hypothetical protein
MTARPGMGKGVEHLLVGTGSRSLVGSHMGGL